LVIQPPRHRAIEVATTAVVEMKIGVIGAGNIGQTLKAMLASIDGVTEITLADNAGRGDVHVDVETGENLDAFVRTHDAVVNALPFYLNKILASACADARRSYFDFSEDIDSAAFVSDLARGEKELVFVPHCGLAPGAINIIGAHLAAQFDAVRTLELRVGALPLSASNEIKYHPPARAQDSFGAAEEQSGRTGSAFRSNGKVAAARLASISGSAEQQERRRQERAIPLRSRSPKGFLQFPSDREWP
jgi:hypothetical protein